METKISAEEFLRLQNQLIALRTANYELMEANAAATARNREVTQRVETLEKELSQLNCSLSKKVRNCDLNMQNQILQLKLQSQEDDFRLQNQTLLKELSLLDAENKRLQSRVCSGVVEAEMSSEAKKLKEEASALERVLSEERLRSANEISKLKTALQVFTEGVDEDVKNELFPGLESIGIPENTMINAVSSPVENMLDGEDSVVAGHEEIELMEGAEDLLECTDSHLVLSHPKQKFELLKSKWEFDVEILKDLVRNKKEKYQSLKTALTALEARFHNCRVLSDQTIHELEKQLDDAMEECKRIKLEKIQLKAEIGNNKLEAGILLSELAKARNKLERMEDSAEILKVESGSLAKSHDELKEEVVRKTQLIDDIIKKAREVTAEYEEKMQMIEKDREGSEYKLKETLEALQELQGKYDSLEKTSVVKEKELEQQVADLAAERALNEKKGSVICRDLKRQLASERRRAEKLQDKLRDLDSSNVKQDSSKAGDLDVSSISSWSLMSGNTDPHELSTQESHITGSPVNTDGNGEETDLEQENKNLLERVTTLQEEKWVLEEKINHLEQGSAAMAEDLMQKADLIKFYCMDSRQGDTLPSNSGRKGVKKLSELLKGSEGESAPETHAPMQHMLEEMLNKNMYLQRDIKHLSQQLETLRHSSKSQ